MGDNARTIGAGRNPALDGIRALAVLAVMAFHANVSWARGGFLGVDTFFVLSGFLITGLLLDEHNRTGRVDLPAFWARRMRRLLPALLVVVAVVALVLAVGSAGNDAFRGDVAATLGYFANWRQIFIGVPYFKQVANPSPLQHMWSLAIEEQFYLAWPLTFVALARVRRFRGSVLMFGLVGATASAGAMALLAPTGGGDASRAYFGTDTRAQALLLGVALAVVVRGLRSRGRRTLQLAGLAGAIATLVLWARLGSDSHFLYRGGFALAALATAPVVAVVSLYPGSVLGRVLGVTPLRVLGRISYGVYLWHWPLQLAMTHSLTGLSGAPLIVLRMVVTILVAAVSFVLIEEPIRRARAVPFRTIPGFAATGIALVAAVALVFPPAAAIAVVAGPAPSAVVLDPVRPRLALPATPQPVARVLPRHVAAPVHRGPAPYPPHTVAFFGDSVSQSLADGLRPIGAAYGEIVTDDAILGCGVTRSGSYKLAGNTYTLATSCARWDSLWTTSVKRDRPDVAAIEVGRHEVLDRQYHGRWTNILDDSYAAYVQTELEKAVTVASSTGAHVALLTAPFYRSRERPDGGSWPENDPARARRVNALERAVAAHHPGIVRLIELGARVDPNGYYAYSVDGVVMRKDGVHFSAAGCAWLAPWLLPQFYAMGPAAAPKATPPPPTPRPTVAPTPSPTVTPPVTPAPSPSPTATSVPGP